MQRPGVWTVPAWRAARVVFRGFALQLGIGRTMQTVPMIVWPRSPIPSAKSAVTFTAVGSETNTC